MSELKKAMKENVPVIKASKKPVKVRPQGYSTPAPGQAPAPDFRYDYDKNVWTRK